MHDDFGYLGGETCARDGCLGIIKQASSDSGCFCHTSNPPCSHCTTPREYCPNCDWDAKEEQDLEYWRKEQEQRRKALEKRLRKTYADLDRTIFDYFISEGIENKTIYVGCYPEGYSSEIIERELKGQKGGTFIKFRGGDFIYVAQDFTDEEMDNYLKRNL